MISYLSTFLLHLHARDRASLNYLSRFNAAVQLQIGVILNRWIVYGVSCLCPDEALGGQKKVDSMSSI